MTDKTPLSRADIVGLLGDRLGDNARAERDAALDACCPVYQRRRNRIMSDDLEVAARRLRRQALADAWDEGLSAGFEAMTVGKDAPVPGNPYRDEGDDDE